MPPLLRKEGSFCFSFQVECDLYRGLAESKNDLKSARASPAIPTSATTAPSTAPWASSANPNANPASPRKRKHLSFSISTVVDNTEVGVLSTTLETHYMRSTIITLSILVALTYGVNAQRTCAPAKHSKLPAITDLTYHRARKLLLKAGWQPVQTINANKASTDVKILWGNGQLFWKKGYREVESCSGTGLAFCSFLFSDAYDNRLRVVTGGEEDPKEKYFARVSNHKFVCGEE